MCSVNESRLATQCCLRPRCVRKLLFSSCLERRVNDPKRRTHPISHPFLAGMKLTHDVGGRECRRIRMIDKTMQNPFISFSIFSRKLSARRTEKKRKKKNANALCRIACERKYFDGEFHFLINVVAAKNQRSSLYYKI